MSKKPIPKQAPAKPGKMPFPKPKKAVNGTLDPATRQPMLALPREIDGKKFNKHPLLWLMAWRMPRDSNKSDIARTLDVRPQSLYKWERACKRDRNFPLPAVRAKQLAEVFKVDPAVFRPDVFAGAK